MEKLKSNTIPRRPDESGSAKPRLLLIIGAVVSAVAAALAADFRYDIVGRVKHMFDPPVSCGFNLDCIDRRTEAYERARGEKSPAGGSMRNFPRIEIEENLPDGGIRIVPEQRTPPAEKPEERKPKQPEYPANARVAV